MTQKALGLIEVEGFLGAVVAADLALKTADVRLIQAETVKAGLKNVQIMGDVGAVKAAIETVKSELGQEPYFISSHVIARMDSQTEQLLFSHPVEGQDVEEETVVLEETPIAVTEHEETQQRVPKYERLKLEGMTVVKLRSLAYQEPAIGLTKKEIKFAHKAILLEALEKIEKE
ncbi:MULTISPECIES: BMC domain-containing protein [unclassified Streptococcus]|uniref:BMC domain-containing protein n=1 Tax=unclassified Streptococcus TaxID=2608887 RepID=UPI0010727FD7|nr:MULTISPECIES: BMC domain-containing protein [unclassified Streptococcus]MBF0805208.1 BMC domain-containing protein [Streptococcus sp. 19428wA2_WM07]TFU29246.1 BMC domain-containing protein [Streptococcus sp. WM07]